MRSAWDTHDSSEHWDMQEDGFAKETGDQYTQAHHPALEQQYDFRHTHTMAPDAEASQGYEKQHHGPGDSGSGDFLDEGQHAEATLPPPAFHHPSHPNSLARTHSNEAGSPRGLTGTNRPDAPSGAGLGSPHAVRHAASDRASGRPPAAAVSAGISASRSFGPRQPPNTATATAVGLPQRSRSSRFASTVGNTSGTDAGGPSATTGSAAAGTDPSSAGYNRSPSRRVLHGGWQVVGGSGSHFIRQLAGAHGGYIECSPQESDNSDLRSGDDPASYRQRGHPTSINGGLSHTGFIALLNHDDQHLLGSTDPGHTSHSNSHNERSTRSESRHDSSLGSTSGSSASNYSSSIASPRNRLSSSSGSHNGGLGHSPKSHLPHPPSHSQHQQHPAAAAAGSIVSGSWGAPSFSLSLEFKCTAAGAHAGDSTGAHRAAWGDNSRDAGGQHGASTHERDNGTAQGADAGGPQPGVFQIILGWQAGWQPRYTALQADCERQRWSLQLVELPPQEEEGQSRQQHLSKDIKTVELASTRDESLGTGFCSLVVELRRGAFLTVARPDTHTTLFSNLPLGPGSQAAERASLGPRGGSGDGQLPRSAATGLLPDGRALIPLGGPLGLAVLGSRLDFKHWAVTPLTSTPAHHSPAKGLGQQHSSSRGQDTGSQSQHQQHRSLFEEGRVGNSSSGSGRLGTSDLGVSTRKGSEAGGGSGGGSVTGAGSHSQPGSPAAAKEAFKGLSASAATAVAVSATAYTNNRWSRKPYVSDADPHLVEAIMNDIIRPQDHQAVTFDDIASLDRAKELLNEAVALPLILPELFTGIREPWKGVLLFGPPGTGKTLLARAVAYMNEVTFFAVSSATLTSKWRGDSEKMVRTLFAVAAHYAPSIIFIDEVDALVSSRDNDAEGDASRRFKAELLQQMDGLVPSMPTSRAARSTGPRGVMVLAASNCPWDLDAALRRRLEKRIHIPLPDEEARYQLLTIHLRGVTLAPDVDMDAIARATSGYSGADLKNICRDAAMAPMRRLVAGRSPGELKKMRSLLSMSGGPLSSQGQGSSSLYTKGQVHSSGYDPGMAGKLVVRHADFTEAVSRIQPSVSPAQVRRYEQWEKEFAAS